MLVAVALAWRLAPASEPAGGQGHIVTLADTGAENASEPSLAIPAAAHAPLPASLAGTTIDGGLTLDAAGRFVPDGAALRLFDYFLSAGGEESEEVLRGRILLHAVGTGLSKKTLSDVAAVLDRYLAYRKAARATLGTGGAAPLDLGARVAEMRALQRSLLGPDLAEAFYGDDRTLADADMKRLSVLRDASMTRDDRQRALAAADAKLSPQLLAARKASGAPAALHQRVEVLRAAGRSSEEIAAVRRAEFGAGAAERLAALDRSRALWDQRLGAYRAEEQALRASRGGPDNPGYRQSIEDLRKRHFSAAELIRVRALDGEVR